LRNGFRSIRSQLAIQKNSPRREFPAGRIDRLTGRVDLLWKTRKTGAFPGLFKQTRPYWVSSFPSCIRTVTVGPGIHRDSERCRQVMHSRARGLYHRSGIAPCPEG
jgi:hypothetical protein